MLRLRGVSGDHVAALKKAGYGTPLRVAQAGADGLRVVHGLGPARTVEIVNLAERWGAGALPGGTVPPTTTATREARLAAGLTQQELADLLGVTKMAVCHWELGRAVPTAENARRLERLLNLEPNAWLVL